jgi:hypothetical protein
MYYVQIWENERDMALQQYIYFMTEYIIIVCFIFFFSVIVHEINIH